MSEPDAFNLDVAASALTAMATIGALIRDAGAANGTGTIPCPRCGGILRFAWAKKRKGSRRLRYTAVCDSTLDCVRFSGH